MPVPSAAVPSQDVPLPQLIPASFRCGLNPQIPSSHDFHSGAGLHGEEHRLKSEPYNLGHIHSEFGKYSLSKTVLGPGDIGANSWRSFSLRGYEK